MSLDHALAEAYVLHTIGELDDVTSRKLMKQIPPEMATTVEDTLRIYEGEESIRVDVVEWIRAQWSQAEGQKPRAFVKAIMDDFLSTLE